MKLVSFLDFNVVGLVLEVNFLDFNVVGLVLEV